MTSDQKYYHELEIMQELDLLEKGTNICELSEAHRQEVKDSETYTEEIKKEIENHIVIEEYYNDRGERND